MNFSETMNSQEEKTIEKIVDLMRGDESYDASADSVKWAKNLFRARAAEPKKSLVKKVLAILQMDLKPHEAIFGERSSSSAAQTRQMFFEAGDYAIDLRVSQTGDKFDVNGQILGENFAGGTIKIGEYETRANDLSEFKLAGISTGKYQLVLQSDETEIVIENLEF